MASAVFHIKDTKAARTELSLLLQIDPKQLNALAENGRITLEFTDLLEDKALHVVAGAVANHGFRHSPTKEPDPKTVNKLSNKAGSK